MLKRIWVVKCVGSMTAVAMLASAASAWADSAYPARPVRIVVGFPPGQTTDMIARTIAQHLSSSMGQMFFVDNKPGAAGIIGTEHVKNAKPDGYTLLFSSSGPMAINPGLYRKLPYDPVKDFAPIGLAVMVPIFLAVNPAVPANNVRELVTYVKSNPNKMNYGSGGNGITAHLAMELLKGATGMDLQHIPYKGSPAAMSDLMAGQVQVMFDSGPSMAPHHRAGKIKVLGVATLNRVKAEPNIPTIAEQGVENFEAVTWAALFAPANTPKAIVDKLSTELHKALKSPALAVALNVAGAETAAGTPEELGVFLRKEVTKWGKAVKDAGAQID